MPKQLSEQIPRPLVEVLKTRVMSMWQQNGMERCLIAPHDLTDKRAREQWQAAGGKLSPCPYKGRRITVKGPRNYDNRNTNLAYWPDDKLQERKSAVFACVIGGTTDFQIGNKMAHCGVGHSIIILPGTPRPDGSTPHLSNENRMNGYCDLLWIGGEADVGLGCWICHSEGGRHFERPGESCHIPNLALMALFETFLQEAASRRNGYRDICNHLFQALLMAMCREIAEGNIFQFNYQKPEPPEENSRDKKNHDPITAAQEYIKNHLHQAVRIDDVARQVLLSRTEFTSRFRRETGKSFHEYLTEVRLEEARRLLSTTAWSIEMVEKAVSFKSSRLRVLFNRHYGMSPQQFRKQNQQSTFTKTVRTKVV